MGALQFISSVISSLSWPLLVFVLVLILRKPLSRMLSLRPISRFEAGPAGVKIEYFDQKIQEVKAELAASASLTASASLAASAAVEGKVAALTPEEEGISERDDFAAEMEKLSEISPSAVVMDSFSRLERTLREALRELGDDIEYRKGIRVVGRRAVDVGILAVPEMAALNDLSAVRNTTAHSFVPLDASRSLEYAMLAGDLISSINSRMAELRASRSNG